MLLTYYVFITMSTIFVRVAITSELRGRRGGIPAGGDAPSAPVINFFRFELFNGYSCSGVRVPLKSDPSAEAGEYSDGSGMLL